MCNRLATETPGHGEVLAVGGFALRTDFESRSHEDALPFGFTSAIDKLVHEALVADARGATKPNPW